MALVEIPGLSEKIFKVLSSDWQSSAVIASQIDMPPDALARLMAKEKNRRGHDSNYACVKAQIVGQRLSSFFLRGCAELERRRVGRKFEYRLKEASK